MRPAKLFPVVFIALVTCLMFFKVFTKGLYPIPGDLLVSFYFPWYAGGWDGYNPWTTHKELLAADAIRQIYLWKELAMNQLKSGNLPVWNPYTLSGQPLLANFQSSAFYPLNVFYFFFDSRVAWILLIISQPLLGGILMYLCAKSFKLRDVSAVFASVTFMFSSYLITWMENGNIAHSYIWFPATIWSMNSFFETKKHKYLLLLVISLALSILGGHPQTAIYLYITGFLFWLFKSSKTILVFLAAASLSLTLSAIQLLPTIEFYKNAPLSLPFSREAFDRSILPLKNLVSFFASDFYGHPTNNNYWAQFYGDFTPYLGVVPLIFSLWAIFRFWKDKFIKFATLTSFFFILAATHGPITYLIKTLKIPILNATTPSRFIAISIFLLTIMAAFGFSDFLKNYKEKKYFTKFVHFLLPIGAIYLSLWIFAILGSKILEPKNIWEINLAVTRRNLILPTFMFLSIPIGTLAIRLIGVQTFLNKIKTSLLTAGVFAVFITGGVYYSNKFLPFSPKDFIFPDHLIFDWLRQNASINRFYASGTAYIDYNFPTHYKIYGTEGYDTLRLERYAELLASSYYGKVPESYSRSDGVFPGEENGYRKRLFEVLGVKYLLDKEDNPRSNADWHYERFVGDEVRGVWQQGKFQVYEREKVLPRIFQTTKHIVAENDSQIIEKIYDPTFDLETLILEKEPIIKIENKQHNITIPELIKYEPNQVIVKTNTPDNTLLYLSDVYDPNWTVEIDGKQTELLRAHYSFRTLALPSGEHLVTFKYQPKAVYQGMTISLVSLTFLILLTFVFIKKKNF